MGKTSKLHPLFMSASLLDGRLVHLRKGFRVKYKNNSFILSMTVAASLSLTGCQLIPTQSAVVGDKWEMVWQDEFNGTEIDTTKWGWETNCWGGGNNELQCYTDRAENSFLRDGKLVIKAQPEEFTGPANVLPLDHDGSDVPQATLPYTSARLRTIQKGDWKYGRIEVRAKIPGGQGIWPAIWMLPTDWVYGGWAASGEIDIMEAVNLGTEETMKTHGTLHYGREWPENTSSGTDFEFIDSDPTEEFHTYAIEWAAGEIRWYVDEVHFATQRESGWYAQAKDEDGELYTVGGAAPFDQRFHLLLNVAVGGGWPGNPDANTEFPVEMEVDFVRVFECPTSKETLITCATKNRKAKRVFGNDTPEIVKVDYDPELINADVVTIFDDESLAPFSIGTYTASGAVSTAVVDDAERGKVAQFSYNSDESVIYFQGPVGFDFSEFSAVEFDVKVLADSRESGGLMMKIDCFHPCSSGDYPIAMPETGNWTRYKVTFDELIKHPGSSLDITNVNTPLVIYPEWGNQMGVVLQVDNVQMVR
jgi:beta-glucanase (GH16 family)